MEAVQNQKGETKLLHEGYIYTKKTVNKTTIRWECSWRRAITTYSEIQRLVRRTLYGHDADNTTVSATKVCTELKATARILLDLHQGSC